jgi:replication factor A1
MFFSNHPLSNCCRWKIRGVITFKYDIRNFSSAHGDGQIFSFDIRDNTGEITITCFNLIAQSMEARIQKDQVNYT